MNRIPELAAAGWVPFDSPLVAFILTSPVIEMTPGPNMAYLAVLGASRGRLAGFSTVAGVAPGLALLGIAVLPELIQGPTPSARETAILISVYVGVATLVHSLIVVQAGGLQTFLATPQLREMAGNIFAVLLLAIAAWLFMSGRRQISLLIFPSLSLRKDPSSKMCDVRRSIA